MPWDSSNTILTIPAEQNPGEGSFSSWVEMKPGETAHIHVERTDQGPIRDWLVELFGSPDGGTKVSTIPLLSYRFLPVDITKDLLVSGLFSWRIRVAQATGAGELVSGTVNYRLDNVNLR